MTLQNLNKTKTAASVVLTLFAVGAQAADEPLITVRKASQQKNDMPLITLHNKGDNRLFKKKTNNIQTGEPRASDYQPINTRDNPLPPISTIAEARNDSVRKQARKKAPQPSQIASAPKNKETTAKQPEKTKNKPNTARIAKKETHTITRVHKTTPVSASKTLEPVTQQTASAQPPHNVEPVKKAPSRPRETTAGSDAVVAQSITTATPPSNEQAAVAQLKDVPNAESAANIAPKPATTPKTNTDGVRSVEPPKNEGTQPKNSLPKKSTSTAIWYALAGFVGLFAAMALSVALRKRKSEFELYEVQKTNHKNTSDTDALLNGTFSWTKDSK